MTQHADPTLLALLTKEIAMMVETLENKTTESLGGDDVSMIGLDEKITRLCEKVQSLPGKEARNFEPLLKKMIITLDRLARAIQNNIKQS